MHLQPKARSTTAQVRLIPWDPDSPAHVQRLITQRIACGWKSELVPSWVALQRSGSIAIQWVVLASRDPNFEAKLAKHQSAHLNETSSLQDTAETLIGKPRIPSNENFVPVGHIGLNTKYESSGHDDETIEGLYWISNFYISSALQSTGLGRAAMDALEEQALGEPMNAKVFALSTVAKENDDVSERWVALGRDPPKLANEEWYARRGYVVYKRVESMWADTDKTGRRWPLVAVFMRRVMGDGV